jgi:tetratricopeptide (TPR) repeat protein
MTGWNRLIQISVLGVSALVLAVPNLALADWVSEKGTASDGNAWASARTEVAGVSLTLRCDATEPPHRKSITIGERLFDGDSVRDTGPITIHLIFELSSGRAAPKAQTEVEFDTARGAWVGSVNMDAAQMDAFGGASTMGIEDEAGNRLLSIPMTGTRDAQHLMADQCGAATVSAAENQQMPELRPAALPAMLPQFFDDQSPVRDQWQVETRLIDGDTHVAGRIRGEFSTLYLRCNQKSPESLSVMFQHLEVDPMGPIELYLNTELPSGVRHSFYFTPHPGDGRFWEGEMAVDADAFRSLAFAHKVRVKLGDGATYHESGMVNSVALYDAMKKNCALNPYELTPERPECGSPDPALSEAGCSALIAVLDDPEKLSLAYQLRADARLKLGDGGGANADVAASVDVTSSKTSEPEETSELWDLIPPSASETRLAIKDRTMAYRYSTAFADLPSPSQFSQNPGLEAFVGRGNKSMMAGAFGDAATAYKWAVELDPDEPTLYEAHAYALSFTARQNDAVNSAFMALRMSPDRPFALALLAKSHEIIDEDRSARQYLSEAQRAKPEQPLAQMVACMLANKENAASAIDICRQAFHTKPRFVGAPYTLALALVRREQNAEARQYFLDAAKLPYQQESVNRYLGFLFAEDGDLEKAIRAYKKVIDRQPDDWVTQYNLALVYNSADQYSQAKQVLDHMLNNLPENHELYAKAKQVLDSIK